MGAEADPGISRELRDKIAKKLDCRGWGQRGSGVLVFYRVVVEVLSLLLLLLLLFLSYLFFFFVSLHSAGRD